METCFNYCDTKKAFFSSDERKWITRVRKMIEQYPDQVRVIALPENNDGCICVELPASWLKIQPKKKVVLTEEEKQALAARLRNYPRTQAK